MNGACMDPQAEMDKRHPATGIVVAIGGAVAFAAAIIGAALLAGA